MEGSTPTMEPLTHDTYAQFFADLKSRIQTAQVRASVAVNRELVLLYWQIGRDILDRQQKESWGAKVIDRLAADLKREFPDMKGFSPRNLKYMRRFAEVWAEEEFVQQLAAIAVVPQLRLARQGCRPWRAYVVRSGRHPARLEPVGVGSPHRECPP